MNDQLHKEINQFFSFLGFTDLIITSTNIPGIDSELLSIDHPGFADFFAQIDVFSATYTFLKKILEKKYPDFSSIIDLHGEQQKKITEAQQKARIAKDRVITYQKPYEFGYLTGFERMIIHAALKDDPSIETISHGKGRDRRLRIELAHSEE